MPTPRYESPTGIESLSKLSPPLCQQLQRGLCDRIWRLLAWRGRMAGQERLQAATRAVEGARTSPAMLSSTARGSKPGFLGLAPDAGSACSLSLAVKLILLSGFVI